MLLAVPVSPSTTARLAHGRGRHSTPPWHDRTAALSSLAALAVCAASFGCGGESDEPLDRCHELAHVGDNPTTVEAAVEHLNRLPSPVTVPCVLASLQRPLVVVATRSATSAQPGTQANPRLFVLLDKLRLSVVPAGTGVPLLEFGEMVDSLHSVKAELLMPISTPVAAAAPYEQVLYDPGSPATGCGFCHHAETLDRTIDGVAGYSSLAYRPHFSQDVALADVKLLHRTCDPETTPFRCELFHALFDFGQVREGSFPEELKTISE